MGQPVTHTGGPQVTMMKVITFIFAVLALALSVVIGWRMSNTTEPEVTNTTVIIHDSAQVHELQRQNQILEQTLQEQRRHNAAQEATDEYIRDNYYMTLTP